MAYSPDVLFDISYVSYFAFCFIYYTLISLGNGPKCHNALLETYSFIKYRYLHDQIAFLDEDNENVSHSLWPYPFLLFSIRQKYVS